METYNQLHAHQVTKILRKLITLQMIFAILWFFVFYLKNKNWALAGCIGALTVAVANYAFYLAVRKIPRLIPSGEFMAIFVVAETLKWLTLILITCAVLIKTSLLPLPFVLGISVALLGHYATMFFDK